LLNELSQIVDSVERLGVNPPSRHGRINPMAKNKELLIVCLAKDGAPSRVEILGGEVAASLFRVEHGSAGSSFPGFNLPTPLRCLDKAPTGKLMSAVEHLLDLAKSKSTANVDLAEGICNLFELSGVRAFTVNQEKQFKRSCFELVSELRKTLSGAPVELKNFLTLLSLVDTAKTTLTHFANLLAELLAKRSAESGRNALLFFQNILFGALDWKKRAAAIGSPDYWSEKAKQDKNANQPVYFDLAEPDLSFKRVAHSGTSVLINRALLEADNFVTDIDRSAVGVDAYTGETVELQDKFPAPKIVEVGNMKLFSVNTNEVRALRRYGLEGAKAFPVSAALTQKMNDALLHLASEENRGISCRPIPSAQPDKRDLLVAYLEGQPAGSEQLAEMFGGEASIFSDTDFAAYAQQVVGMLEGKVAANPDLNIRLLSFCSIDKGRKQISLNRRFRVADVIRAAKDWQTGARNVPAVSVGFYDKASKQLVFRTLTTPCPIELASTINRVWSSDAKAGFSSNFQRAFSASDAYDIFLANAPLARQKAEAALGLLIQRMSVVLAGLGVIKTTREWTRLSDAVRWQSLKTIALLGILLRQLGHHREDFMQKTIPQFGRLLALADSLHLQYCKYVRKGESPSQLIGNALFSTALEQPVFALARLAERLTPYQAWARTFQSDDPNAGVGLIKYFLGEIAACTAAIHLEQLPDRMLDADKAKLLLGYLADHSKNDTPIQ
jgi:hypothetical protein